MLLLPRNNLLRRRNQVSQSKASAFFNIKINMSSEFLQQLGIPDEIDKHPNKIHEWLLNHQEFLRNIDQDLYEDLLKDLYKDLLIVMCMGESKGARFSAMLALIATFQNRRECDGQESRSAEADKVARHKLPKEEDLENPVIYVAQDVMFIDEAGNPVHKPKSIEKADIKRELMALLHRNNDKELIELKLRIGLAVGTSQLRGMSFYEIIHFTLTSFSEEEIDKYVEQMSVSLLKQTNGACRWEMPPFINHVVQIAGINKNNQKFDEMLDSLALAVMAVYPGYLLQIIEAINFLINSSEVTWINHGCDPDSTSIGPE